MTDDQMTDTPLSPATIAAHAAGATDPQGGVVPGVQVSTTYARGPDYALTDPQSMYLRDDNRTVQQAEEVIRQLEGAAETRLFASGMAAATALFRTVPDGGRIVVQSGIYFGITHFLRGFCARRNITLTEVDTSDPDALARACATPADLVWAEVPSNPWLRLTDIAAAADLAHGAGALLAVDATAATPVLMRPLSLGADVVMHSATKALNGHSDVLAGVLSVADPSLPVWDAVKADRHDSGAVLGPFGAWLLLRGLRTLPLRVDRMSRNAMAVAEALAPCPGVQAVWYPGLPAHPQHALATRLMQGGFGGLMSVLVKGGAQDALAVAGRLRLIHRATSLGGVESLIEHRASIEPQSGIPPGLLRLSVGIEDAGDLIADLVQALAG